MDDFPKPNPAPQLPKSIRPGSAPLKPVGTALGTPTIKIENNTKGA